VNRNRVQLRRLLAFDERVRSSQYPNCIRFAAEWEVSRKTVQRDVEYLRDQLGAPLAYDQRRQGYSYTDRNWFLPAIGMSEGDLVLLMVGARATEQYRGSPIAAEIDRIFQKIATMLPERLTIRPETVFSAFSFIGPPSKPVDTATWTTLVRGLLNRRSVDVSYRAFDAEQYTPRRIDPYHIANLHGEWYVFARCQVKGDVRQFAIPRVEKAELTDEEFTVPAAFSARERLGSAFARFAGDASVKRVRLLFSAAVERWVTDCQWHPSQRLRKRRDGRLDLSFDATGLLEVKRWVLGWGRDVRVVAPRELRQMVQEEIRAMAKGTA